ncbi:hypothetical protein O6H91_01G065100 [Diphasiastrum complanatum]|uniref:Uncharacterized protein n=1 Tax=Diphasiastrum complanatum TaxID=34168 RepID=A0ACC2ERU8_DIPCM|nr:hypothetical protein O6H91_01G065100 [Diphasiastrum complanatum]
MASLEMLRSKRTFQQWAMMDRSKLYEPHTDQKDWAGVDEEKEESGVELSLGLGLGGSSECKTLEASTPNEWIGDAASSKRLKLQKPVGGLEAAIKTFHIERSIETSLDYPSKEMKAIDSEAGQDMVDLALYQAMDESNGGARIDSGPWTSVAQFSSSGDSLPLLSAAYPDSKGGSQILTNPNLSVEHESGDRGRTTNCSEPLKESQIQEALIEQHRSTREAHIQKQQLARKKRKMLIDEQKQQKRGKEDERANLISGSRRPGSSPWARSWPKEVENAVVSYGDQNLESDQQLDKLDKADQLNQGEMEIDGEGLSGSKHGQFLAGKNGFNGDVESQRAQLHPSDRESDAKQALNCHMPDPASLLLQRSGDSTKEDDPNHASSQRRGNFAGKGYLSECLPADSRRKQPLHRPDSSVAEVTDKQDDSDTLSAPSATTNNTFPTPSCFGNKVSLPPTPISFLPYHYQIPFHSGSGLPFPVSFPYPHLVQMLRSPTTDAQSHGRPVPVQKISTEDPVNRPQTRKIDKERSRPASPQLEPSDNLPCVIQSQASTSGPIQRESSDPSIKITNHKSGDQPLSRQGSTNSAFTSLIAAVKASQGLSAAIAAISNSSPSVSVKSQMVLEPSASQVRNALQDEKNSGKSQSDKPSDTGRTDASGIPVSDKEVQGLLGIYQLGTTKDIPGIESLAKEPYNLRLGLASEQMFGGTGSSPDLPWVSTSGEGENGKPVIGVVYRRHQGPLQIVCACHGKHMSPGEFVQHAGPVEMINTGKGSIMNSLLAEDGVI